jgi:hypothetical protein
MPPCPVTLVPPERGANTVAYRRAYRRAAYGTAAAYGSYGSYYGTAYPGYGYGGYYRPGYRAARRVAIHRARWH